MNRAPEERHEDGRRHENRRVWDERGHAAPLGLEMVLEREARNMARRWRWVRASARRGLAPGRGGGVSSGVARRNSKTKWDLRKRVPPR